MGTEQQLKSKGMPRVLERQRSSPVSPRLRARKVVTWALDKETQPAGEGGESDKDEASDKENAKNPQRPRALAMASGRKGPKVPQMDEAEGEVNAMEDEVEGACLEESGSVKGKLEVLQRAHVDALRHRLGVGVEVEALRLEIQSLREENRVLREARVTLEKENAILKKDFHAALRDNQAWCRESEVLQEEFTQAFLEKTTEVFEKTLALEKESETLRHENEALKVSLAAAESSRNAAVRQNKAWQHENEVLHEEYKEHLSQSVEILRENTALKEQIAVSNDEYSRITASTKAYVHKLLETKAAVKKVDPEFAGDGDNAHVDVPRVASGSNRSIEIFAGAGCDGMIDPTPRQQQQQQQRRHQRHQARPSLQANGLSSRGRSKAVATPSMKPPEQEGERALVGPGSRASEHANEGVGGGGEGGVDEGERDRRQRQRKGLSLPTDVRGELAKMGGLEVWVQGWKWLWSDDNEQVTKKGGSNKQEESKRRVRKNNRNLEGQVEGREEVAEDGAVDGVVRTEARTRPTQRRSAIASASRGGRNKIAAARAAMREQKVHGQQQRESVVDVGDGDKDREDCSETEEAKAWKSDNECWLEGTKTWKRADKVLKRVESLPSDFWGAESREDFAIPVTLSMKLENRAFRADYIETLRASQLSPCPAVDYDDFSEGSTDTDEGF